MIEVALRFVNNEIICDSDDPDALLRDAKRYRRTSKQTRRRIRSGKFAKNNDAVERSFVRLAEACERRAAQLKSEKNETSG